MADHLPEVPPKFAGLLARCNKAGLKATYEFDEEDEYSLPHLSLDMPAGRSTVTLHVAANDVKRLSGIEFERYRFVSGYQAVYLPSERQVEAIVESPSRLSGQAMLRRLHRRSGELPTLTVGAAQATRSFDPLVVHGGQNVTLRLGEPSTEAATLLEFGSILSPLRLQRSLSLQISGIDTDRHDKVKEALEKLGNAFLFQLDMLSEIPLFVAPSRELRVRLVPTSGSKTVQWKFPDLEYDREPMALYWYARSATAMPLLQFLAFYQVIEFYFPVFMRLEAQRLLQNALKDPAFNIDHESHVSGLLAKLLPLSRTGGIGKEDEQLLAVLQHCIQPDDVRNFLQEDQDRHEFFKEHKDKSSRISDVRIPVDEPQADLLRAVAQRIYDIRCKIVHSKDEQPSAKSAILPFSREEQELGPDVRLVQFIGRKVLISASKKLRL